MSDHTEVTQCDVCGIVGPVVRTYFAYDLKCECHSPSHFEIVSHCKGCTPVEPKVTTATIKTSSLTKI